MPLQKGAERTLHSVDLKTCESNFFVSVKCRVERKNGDLLFCDVLVDRVLGSDCSTAFDVGHYRKTWANGGCQSRTGRQAPSMP